MTFQELLQRYKTQTSGKSQEFLDRSAIGEYLVLASQIDANRMAIEEIKKALKEKQKGPL